MHNSYVAKLDAYCIVMTPYIQSLYQIPICKTIRKSLTLRNRDIASMGALALEIVCVASFVSTMKLRHTPLPPFS